MTSPKDASETAGVAVPGGVTRQGGGTVGLAPGSLSFCLLGGIGEAERPQLDWALGELKDCLRDLAVELVPVDAPGSGGYGGTGRGRAETTLVLALGRSREIERFAGHAGVALPDAPESFAVFSGGERARFLHLFGADIRGLIYAITELADRARCSGALPSGLDFPVPLVETPAARVRSISRCFQSDVEDLPWFHDREGWQDYLTLLVTHRFNRITLTLGMQYNYPYGNEFLSDVYFYFAYPFLVAVPGHDVKVSNLDDAERARNLETLKFIAREADRRGLEFQLALWTQRYDFEEAREANHHIFGLDDRTIAPYCRDALARILAEVPEIGGLTLRVHVECGIPEGDYDFWRTYFQAVTGAGRTIRLDLHAKGIDGELIEIALATGMPVTISPKYTSEHLGLPYHQASIRRLELPDEDAGAAAAGQGAAGQGAAVENAAGDPPGRDLAVLYAGDDAEKHAAKWRFSEGSRKFMRYSYGDLLSEERAYDIVFRIWPGTLRILLWGDAELAAGYGRNASFCGAGGIELCEPLSFKGRMGTGLAGGRGGYRDAALAGRRDWEKFAYTYRVWGRSLYDPAADPQAFRRDLARRFGAAAGPCGRALASASRILPLITLAHTPTASNNSYWPELYENMSIVHEAPRLPYGYELYRPARFGTVGACDPQLFSSPAEFAGCLQRGEPVRKLAPLTWANWLARLAADAGAELACAEACLADPDAGFRRLAVDVSILAAVGRFFAEKVRAAVLWEFHLLTGEVEAAREALAHYRRARDAWAQAAEAGREVYVADLTYGPHSWLRGRWDDRLPAIEQDVADMAGLVERAGRAPGARDSALGRARLEQVRAWSSCQQHPCRHQPPAGFTRGADLELSCAPFGPARRGVFLHYRHVNQAEPWRVLAMAWTGEAYEARIPGAYTASPYPLQYYFEVEDGACAQFYPGLVETLSNVPYFVVSALGPDRRGRRTTTNDA